MEKTGEAAATQQAVGDARGLLFDAGERERPVLCRGGGGDNVAGTVEKSHRHLADSSLIRILVTIAVDVEPHFIGDVEGIGVLEAEVGIQENVSPTHINGGALVTSLALRAGGRAVTAQIRVGAVHDDEVIPVRQVGEVVTAVLFRYG